ncbi:hypothetical protein N7462_011020, partial [Penicillium macrosclerotiorum]|uniref:uncharacterized protein n=1 Tax=Penicillium macrosclerotiorum TaxID=303699 RepID=UPI0025476C94
WSPQIPVSYARSHKLEARQLQSILMALGSTSLTISSQSDADNLSNCDSLDGSITISSSASGVITLNNVEEIKGSLTAEGASGLTRLIAPDLETLKGALTLENLNSLTNLTLSALAQVSSGIAITNNAKLKTLDLEELEQVDGELKLTGSFTSISLPSLDEVNGKTTIRGSRSMSCSALNSLQSDNVYQGDYQCSVSSSSLTAGVKGGIAIGVILGVLLIVILLWYLFRQRQQRQRKTKHAPLSPISSPSVGKETEKGPSPLYQPLPLEDQKPSMPRKPVGSAIQLDGRSIYEAPIAPTPVREYHELDAGPVLSSHQRPIHAE